ncbi:MAG: hypothetical protein Q9163_006430 [Psora crenata]
MPHTGASVAAMTPSTTDGSRGSEVGSNSATQTGFYPSLYQAHLEQLEQEEYDAHAMLDDENPSDTSNGPGTGSGPGSYPQTYPPNQIPSGTALPMVLQGQPRLHPVHQMQQMQPPPPPPPTTSHPVDANNPTMYGVMPGLDPYDPSLDADPFGLTASMHFPTQFTYQESNDSDQDSDKEPALPVKVAEKPIARTGKRDASANAPSEARAAQAGGERGGRRRGYTGNDDASRDHEAGSRNNRGKPPDDGLRPDRHPARVEGGRGGRGGRGNRGDRQPRGYAHDHVKQADLSWGAPTGTAEWQDEQAGEAIAKADEKEEGAASGWDSGGAAPISEDADGTAPPNGAASVDAANAAREEEPEPEDNSKSYADYLAEQREKKLRLGAQELKAREPNEGTKAKKEWENAKPISKEDEEGDFMAGLGKGEKAKRERAKKEKQTLNVDIRYVEPHRGGSGERGGRGRGRGDRGDFRGRGRGRGDGFRGRGEGGYRGGRGSYRGGNSEGAPVNVEDQSAFPSLGGGS